MILPNEGKNFIRLVSTDGLTEEEWREWRRRSPVDGQWHIGGSEWAQILGLSTYGGPLSIWADKLKMTPETEQTELMYWGTTLEDIVAREFTQRTGIEVHRVKAILRSIEFPFATANIDRRVIGLKEGVECKNVGEWAGRYYEGQDFYPGHYVQCQAYMMITGWDKWHLAMLIGGQKWICRTFEPDSLLHEQMKAVGPVFVQHLLNGEAPTANAADTETLSCLHPVEYPGLQVSLPEDTMEHFWQYDAAHKTITAAEKEKDAAKNCIRQLLAGAESGVCGDRKATWKTNVKGSRVLNIK